MNFAARPAELEEDMITAIIGSGQIQITGPSGGLSAGDGFFDGCRFGIVPNDVAEGASGYMLIEGCFELPFNGGATPTKNAKAYWDPTGKKIYAAWSSGRVLCGSFYAAAGTNDTTCQIMLDGGCVDEIEKGDITGVTAGTGLTGGGTAGAVTLSADIGTGATQVAAGNHTHTAADSSYANAALPDVGDTEEALDAIVDVLRVEPQVKRITVALGATSGASAGDTTMIGGRVTGYMPVSGADQTPSGYAIDGTTGVITLTLAAASTAEAVYDVWVKPVLPA